MSRARNTGRSLAPGLTLTACGVAIAFVINSVLPVVSTLTAAVLLGVIVGNIGYDLRVVKAGLDYATKRLLRAGIVVLGLQLAIRDVLGLGVRGLSAIVVIVAATFFGTQLIGRALHVSSGSSLLIATGFSICGASAIAAMDGVTSNEEREVVTAIALVTMYGSLAIVLLPWLQAPLELTDVQFGLWSGASVHEVAQVVATASVAGSAALAPAVIVKLTRVVLLAPLVTAMSIARRRSSAGSGEKPPILPLFVIGFLVMVAIRSLDVLPADLLSAAQVLESVLLAAALFGLGASVHLKTLFTTGGRAALLGLISWIGIAALSLAAIPLIGTP